MTKRIQLNYAYDNGQQNYVILLHGLARSACSMKRLAQALEQAGYQTINVSYPSTKEPIESLALKAIPAALSLCQDASKIHFVTHSMGAILLRYYLSQHPIPQLGKTVMLGPPNHGSEIVDKLGSLCLFKWLNGPAGQQLSTAQDSLPNRLPAFPSTLGIIAATRNYNPIYASIMPSPHDGKVSVESTRLAGMSAHIELPVTHSFMMNNKQVIRHVIQFINQTCFLN